MSEDTALVLEDTAFVWEVPASVLRLCTSTLQLTWTSGCLTWGTFRLILSFLFRRYSGVTSVVVSILSSFGFTIALALPPSCLALFIIQRRLFSPFFFGYLNLRFHLCPQRGMLGRARQWDCWIGRVRCSHELSVLPLAAAPPFRRANLLLPSPLVSSTYRKSPSPWRQLTHFICDVRLFDYLVADCSQLAYFCWHFHSGSRPDHLKWRLGAGVLDAMGVSVSKVQVLRKSLFPFFRYLAYCITASLLLISVDGASTVPNYGPMIMSGPL